MLVKSFDLLGVGFNFNMSRGQSNKGDMEGFPTLKLVLDFSCKITHIMKRKITMKIYLVGNISW